MHHQRKKRKDYAGSACVGSGSTTLSKTRVLEVCATSVGHKCGPHLRRESYLVRGAFAFLPAVRCVGVGCNVLLLAVQHLTGRAKREGRRNKGLDQHGVQLQRIELQ